MPLETARALGRLQGIAEQSERNNDERHGAVLARIDENRTALTAAINGSTDGWKEAVAVLRADHDKRLLALEEHPARLRRMFASLATGCVAVSVGILAIAEKLGLHL